MRSATLALVFCISGACRSSAGPVQEDSDELKRRVEELMKEVLRLRGELARARVEVLKLKLVEARRLPNSEEEERKLLLQEGIDCELPEVQQYAFTEMSNLPVERRRAGVPEVLRRWPTAGEGFRARAVPFLSASGDPRAEEAVLGAARDPSPEVRRAVAAVLNLFANGRGLAALVEMLRDSQKEVRAAAIDALGTSKRDEAVRALVDFVRGESDPSLLERAAEAFGILGLAEAVPALLDLLASPSKSVRWSSIRALGRIGDARAVEPLRPFLDADQPQDIRESAIASLGKLKDAASLPRFERILAEETEARLREKAAQAIGRVGDAGALERSLFPAYASEKEEAVRTVAWKAILQLSEKDLALLDKVVSWVIGRKGKPEVEEVARKVYAWRGEDGAARLAAIAEKIAGFAFEEKMWLQALEHYAKLVQWAPQHWDGFRRIAACYLELGDAQSALDTLNGAAEKVRQDPAVWWSLKEDTLKPLAKLDDPARIVEETYGLLRVQPPAPSETLKTSLQAAYDAAAARLVESLRSPEEAARKSAVETARKLAQRIILPLAAALEPKPAVGLIDAGNAIAGTTLDPASTDAARLKETADAWRAWYDKNK